MTEKVTEKAPEKVTERGTEKVAVLGTGKIGEALLSGMIRSGWSPSDLLVTARRPERAAELRARHGVEAVSNADAAKIADTLILTVKPQDMGALLDELAPHVPADRLVISGAAGIPTAFFEARLAVGTPVVRVMTNTPALVDEAMSVISAGSHATEEHLAHAEAIFGSVGKTLRVPETQQDAATALSGSGPAYFYFLVEAMTDAGILLGLPRDKAHDLIVQAAIGAAVMLRDSGEHPVKLREAVTSPAGTTISAIRELESHGVRAALIAALEAARDRSRELASGNG
ncbi:pyrroline-5-carboxylate reductase [Streptomyces bingchenggensis BCW-1]|uniref:Pyrroline-5-carboxylate reductase n=1 Tax=Streptomyces bingchenggensis (strain BCW-1) TaxID=749414 RepID=D7CHR5_STRBB|nr:MULTISPECIES: pyrroline-5-carboxylate reductase [Streptomyces]ADI09115.1 pyrroline-5-carboxylate reductase [Streptomyces bingchenggensis BCW-1]